MSIGIWADVRLVLMAAFINHALRSRSSLTFGAANVISLLLGRASLILEAAALRL